MGNLLNMSGGRLLNNVAPYDYEVEWIWFPRTAYIDTGIYPTIDTVSYLQFYVDRNSGGSMYGFTNLDNNDFRLTPYVGCFFYDFSNQRLYNKNVNPLNTWFNVELGNYYMKDLNTDTFILRGTRINTFTATNTIQLGDGGNNYKSAEIKFKHIQILEDSTIVRDYIPVVKDGVACLYDKASDTLHYNQGTGDFVEGPRVN